MMLTCGAENQYKNEGKDVEGSVVGSSTARPAGWLLGSITSSGKLSLEEGNRNISPQCTVL